MPFCNVYLVNTKLGGATDEKGNFIIENISAGIYTVKASALGYGDTSLTNVFVKDDSITTVRFVLPIPCKYDVSYNDRTCPKCGRTGKVVPIMYGLIVIPSGKAGKQYKREHYMGGCDISSCDPNWYCRERQTSILKKKNFG